MTTQPINYIITLANPENTLLDIEDYSIWQWGYGINYGTNDGEGFGDAGTTDMGGPQRRVINESYLV